MKTLRKLSVFILLTLLCTAALCARAEESFTLRVAADMSSSAGKKTYKRDLLTPLINGESGFLYKQGSKTNAYLFSFDPDYTRELTLSFAENVRVASVKLNGQAISGGETVSLKEEFTLDVVTDKGTTSLRVTITSLPIASLTCPLKSLTTEEETANGAFVLVDPAYQKRGYADYRFESDANITYRGNTARYYTQKRNFSVNLLSDAGEKLDMSLLGLRCDNGWILDGMYNDPLRMRNRVAFQLWDEFFQSPYNDKISGAFDGAFVEVFLNGEYKGIYCLNERVDRKQLKVDKQNGIVYRSTLAKKSGADIASFEFSRYVPPTAANEWYNMEIRYPNDGLSVDTWTPFYNLCRLVITEKDAAFTEQIENLVYTDNLIDYYVFINVIGATDNMAKNMFWACEDLTEDTRLALFPWDLDAILGRRYNGVRTVIKESYSNRLFDRLLSVNVNDFSWRMRSRYAALRATFLNTAHIMALIQENYDIVERAGGWTREMALHPYFTDHQKKNTIGVNPLKEMDVVENYLTLHLKWLDDQMGYVQR